jgi:hypothetical protein
VSISSVEKVETDVRDGLRDGRHEVADGRGRGDGGESRAEAGDAEERLGQHAHHGPQRGTGSSALAGREQLRWIDARSAHVVAAIAFRPPRQRITAVACRQACVIIFMHDHYNLFYYLLFIIYYLL